MYNPPLFRETHADVLRRAMAAHPLAALVTTGSQGLGASHLPLLYDPAAGPSGVPVSYTHLTLPTNREV